MNEANTPAMYAAVSAVRAVALPVDRVPEPGAVERIVDDMHDRYGTAGVYELVVQLAAMAADDFESAANASGRTVDEEIDAYEQAVLRLEDKGR
jgi:triphosphoribosyl-dephospho-CoA synthetase